MKPIYKEELTVNAIGVFDEFDGVEGILIQLKDEDIFKPMSELLEKARGKMVQFKIVSDEE